MPARRLITMPCPTINTTAIINTVSWAGVFRMPSDTISVVAPAGGWGTLNHTMNPLVRPSDTAAAPTRGQVTASRCA